MKQTELARPAFVFLSELIGKKIKASSGSRYILADFVAIPTEVYPRCTGIVVRKPFSRVRSFVSWQQVSRTGGQFCLLKDPESFSLEYIPEPESFLLGGSFLDRQIVDISGSKVVRVNDLHILSENSAMWLVHFDIGFSGILRRLGWLSPVNRIIGWLLHVKCPERMISWKYVQPVPPSAGAGTISLKVNQRKLSEMHPADLAEILTDLSVDERSSILESLDIETAARTLQEIPLKFRAPLIESMSREKASGIIMKMHTDEAVDLFPELSGQTAREILSMLSPEQSADIRELLVHSGNSAGGIMNTRCLTGSASSTVSEIIARIRDFPHEWETVSYVYVIDDDEMIIGVVSIRELVSAEPSSRLESIMKSKVVMVEPGTSVGRVAALLFKYNFAAIPVADDGRLMGIVSMRDAFGSNFPDIKTDVEDL